MIVALVILILIGGSIDAHRDAANEKQEQIDLTIVDSDEWLFEWKGLEE